MKHGDRVKIINPLSSFCGDEGTVVYVDRSVIEIYLNNYDSPLAFYKHEVELIDP